MSANLKEVPNRSQNPQAVVEIFLESLSELDFESALALLDDDCDYRNVPFHRSRGRKNIAKALGSMEKAMTNFSVDTLNIAVNGDTVLTERIDTLGGKYFSMDIPLMGIFVVKDGKITEWRDYFDWSLTVGRLGKSLLSNPFSRK